MGDDHTDLLGMRLDQSQRAHRAAAGADHHGRVRVSTGHEPGEVVGAHLRRRVPAGVVDRAAVDAPRVVVSTV
jgi:hypothetical protein